MLTKPTLAALLTAVVTALAAPTAMAQADVDYRRAADALIVRLTEAGGEIDASEGHPSLEIYGDGRVVVRRPAYMKNAGEHVSRLAPAELDRLISSLAAKGLPAFDADATRGAKRAALQSRLAARAGGGPPPRVRASIGAPTTVIELHLESYRAVGSDTPSKVDRTVSWSGVKVDAEEYPGIEALQNLAAAREELLLLMKRPDATANE